MTREFAWKPRSATIRFVNSAARSTFDISSVPPDSVPRPPWPATPICGDARVDRRRCTASCPSLCRPAGFGERRQRDLAERLAAAVREHAGDQALLRRR